MYIASIPTCWLAPCAEGRDCADKGGRGVFALRDIHAGEVLAVWGGEVIAEGQLPRVPEHRRLAIQIDENLYLMSAREGPADWINHSCTPNAGMRGQISLVAMGPICEGEEICYDYAMTDGSAYDEFACACGSPRCRGFVSGSDWQRPELVARYGEYFSTYLQVRIRVAAHSAQSRSSRRAATTAGLGRSSTSSRNTSRRP